MSARRKSPERGEWFYTVGDVPVQLTAFERTDRGCAIYSRIWDGNAYRAKRWLCDSIRDSGGRVDPALELQAQQAAMARQKAALQGEEPAGPLTVRLGFRKMLDGDAGKFAGDSQWKRNIASYAKTIEKQVGDVLCADLKHRHYRELWRALAHTFVAKGTGGLRATEKLLGALRSMVTWLQTEGLLEPGVGLPAPHWIAKLREEWAEITERPVQPPRKPRHTRAEQEKLWENIGVADPRLALAMEIGAELRLGQVTRSRRTDIVPHKEHELGAVRVHGKGKKRGALVVLTPAQRAALNTALTSGFLRDLERAYRAGKISDYYLIPGGKLRGQRAQLKHAERSWAERRMQRAWRQFEDAAGVKHVQGRGWYGMRRLAADQAEDESSDARVLNRLGAWTHTETREGYQEQGRVEIEEKAAEVRERIRPRKAAQLPQKVTPLDDSGVSQNAENAASE